MQVSAGTNNARVASQLRSLSSYYYKEPSLLFLLRCAQGLTHMGKGLLTLNPYHSDKLMSNTAMAGLLATVFCGLDMKSTVLTKYHHVLYYLVRLELGLGFGWGVGHDQPVGGLSTLHSLIPNEARTCHQAVVETGFD